MRQSEGQPRLLGRTVQSLLLISLARSACGCLHVHSPPFGAELPSGQARKEVFMAIPPWFSEKEETCLSKITTQVNNLCYAGNGGRQIKMS